MTKETNLTFIDSLKSFIVANKNEAISLIKDSDIELHNEQAIVDTYEVIESFIQNYEPNENGFTLCPKHLGLETIYSKCSCVGDERCHYSIFVTPSYDGLIQNEELE